MQVRFITASFGLPHPVSLLRRLTERNVAQNGAVVVERSQKSGARRMHFPLERTFPILVYFESDLAGFTLISMRMLGNCPVCTNVTF